MKGLWSLYHKFMPLQEEVGSWLWVPERAPTDPAWPAILWHHGECTSYSHLFYAWYCQPSRNCPTLFSFYSPLWRFNSSALLLLSMLKTNRCHSALWLSCLGGLCTQTRSRHCLGTTGSPSALPSRLRSLLSIGWNVSHFFYFLLKILCTFDFSHDTVKLLMFVQTCLLQNICQRA